MTIKKTEFHSCIHVRAARASVCVCVCVCKFTSKSSVVKCCIFLFLACSLGGRAVFAGELVGCTALPPGDEDARFPVLLVPLGEELFAGLW